jgi:ribonuclease HI
MGFRWLITEPQYLSLNFKRSTYGFASSTKAETIAILTSLIVCAENSNTDSLNAINTFNLVMQHKLSARRFCKLNNHILWNAIINIIESLKLQVQLIKVKAHSGDALNDLVDTLAKVGQSSNNIITITYLISRCL